MLITHIPPILPSSLIIFFSCVYSPPTCSFSYSLYEYTWLVINHFPEDGSCSSCKYLGNIQGFSGFVSLKNQITHSKT